MRKSNFLKQSQRIFLFQIDLDLLKVNNSTFTPNMEQSNKIENLRLSFFKLQALGVFDYEDRYLPIKKLTNKLYAQREQLERQLSGPNGLKFRNNMAEK